MIVKVTVALLARDEPTSDKMSVLYGQESRICIPFGVLWISNDSRASVFY